MNFDSFAEIINSARKVAVQLESNNRMPRYRSIEIDKYKETFNHELFPTFGIPDPNPASNSDNMLKSKCGEFQVILDASLGLQTFKTYLFKKILADHKLSKDDDAYIYSFLEKLYFKTSHTQYHNAFHSLQTAHAALICSIFDNTINDNPRRVEIIMERVLGALMHDTCHPGEHVTHDSKAFLEDITKIDAYVIHNKTRYNPITGRSDTNIGFTPDSDNRGQRALNYCTAYAGVKPAAFDPQKQTPIPTSKCALEEFHIVCSNNIASIETIKVAKEFIEHTCVAHECRTCVGDVCMPTACQPVLAQQWNNLDVGIDTGDLLEQKGFPFLHELLKQMSTIDIAGDVKSKEYQSLAEHLVAEMSDLSTLLSASNGDPACVIWDRQLQCEKKGSNTKLDTYPTPSSHTNIRRLRSAVWGTLLHHKQYRPVMKNIFGPDFTAKLIDMFKYTYPPIVKIHLGPSATGKSTSVKSFIDDKDKIIVDSDVMMQQLPKMTWVEPELQSKINECLEHELVKKPYDTWTSDDAETAKAFLKEKGITKKIIEEQAIKEKKDIIVNETLSKLEFTERFKMYQEQGYTFEVECFIANFEETTKQRLSARDKGGNVIPKQVENLIKFVEGIHSGIVTSYWDTSSEKKSNVSKEQFIDVCKSAHDEMKALSASVSGSG